MSTQAKVTVGIVTAAAIGIAYLSLMPDNGSVQPPSIVLPDFKYPTNATNHLWALEVSTNLVNWTTVTKNYYFTTNTPPSGSAVITNKTGQLFARMRMQKGWE